MNRNAFIAFVILSLAVIGGVYVNFLQGNEIVKLSKRIKCLEYGKVNIYNTDFCFDRFNQDKK